MSDAGDTKPTLETVVSMLGELRADINRRFDALEIRLDRIEAVAHDTKGNFHTLRADFNELRGALKEQSPSAVK